MGDIAKIDNNEPPPRPAESWTQTLTRKAKEDYELNKVKRQDRLEEAELQSRELENRKRKVDIQTLEHNLHMRIFKDSTAVLEQARKEYEEFKQHDDYVEESGPIESVIACKFRKTIEEWSAR